jgi:hypothetical protein
MCLHHFEMLVIQPELTMSKNIYICDFMGEPEKEVAELKDETGLEIKHEENPNFEEHYFDVLFFDWGGASLGNSMMDHFCRRILNHANEHPSRFYVMTSNFTKAAMKDAIREFGDDKPANIFLTVDEFKPYAEVV